MNGTSETPNRRRYAKLLFVLVLAFAGLCSLLGALQLDVVQAVVEADAPVVGEIAYFMQSDYDALTNDDKVALVDTTLHQVLGYIDVGASGCEHPRDAAMTPDGTAVLVSCGWSNNVVVIDTGTNQVTQVIGNISPYGNSTTDIAFTRDGRFAAVGGYPSCLLICRLTRLLVGSALGTYLASQPIPLGISCTQCQRQLCALLTQPVLMSYLK